MNVSIDIIKKCPLFAGIKDAEIPAMLHCLSAREKRYRKEEFIFSVGDKPGAIGVVLSGRVHILREDYWGNRTILTFIEPGNLFGEAFSCAGAAAFPVSAMAHQDTDVLWIDYQKIITACSSACVFHLRLIQNMLTILANKNIMLTHKIEHITQKTMKEKILSYLSEQALRTGRDEFIIPFNRQELADYLSVERSALSNTLSQMRTEGSIDFHKNKFKIMRPAR